MEALSWSAAFAIVGSVLGVCLTVLKLVLVKRDKTGTHNHDPLWKAMKEHDARCDVLAGKVARLESQLVALEKDTDRQEAHLNKVDDLILRLLTSEDN